MNSREGPSILALALFLLHTFIQQVGGNVEGLQPPTSPSSPYVKEIDHVFDPIYLYPHYKALHVQHDILAMQGDLLATVRYISTERGRNQVCFHSP